MPARLLDVLEEARARGLLGPGPVESHVDHARGLARLVGSAPTSFLDLGSGGGVPGLVLADEWPHAQGVLLESRGRRCSFLRGAVAQLELGRIAVACGRAEDLAREPALRASVELVVARSFGRPAVTAECAVGFLQPGGRLLVADPPGAEGDRWPVAGVSVLGLTGPEVCRAGGVTAAVLTLPGAVDDRWPRRSGIPAKRPTW
ncbi:MAG: 16S rRNA (guanine(527)-N(7))-methyltransferase RsmG [Acidimicrobiia bacterium]